MTETGPRSLRLVRQEPAAVMALHWHARPRLCCVLGGGFEEDAGGARSRHGQGAVLFRPSGLEHEERFGSHGAAYGVIDVGELFVDTAERWGFDLGAASSANHPAHYRFSAVLGRETDFWDEYSPVVCETLALECLAVLVRARHDLKTEVAVGGLAARTLDFVRNQLDQPFGLAEAASAVGAHPSHVARAFRRAYGESIGAFARRARVRARHRFASHDKDPAGRDRRRLRLFQSGASDHGVSSGHRSHPGRLSARPGALV